MSSSASSKAPWSTGRHHNGNSDSQPQRKVTCKFFQEGRCKRGERCTFQHVVKASKLKSRSSSRSWQSRSMERGEQMPERHVRRQRGEKKQQPQRKETKKGDPRKSTSGM
eukprot:10552042-Karenia_brevis.AAC.1